MFFFFLKKQTNKLTLTPEVKKSVFSWTSPKFAASFSLQKDRTGRRAHGELAGLMVGLLASERL